MTPEFTTNSAELPQRRSLPHHVPAWVKPDSLYFITICCASRKENQLCNPAMAAVIFKSVEHRQNAGSWYARLVLLMPDHLHALIAFRSDSVMSVAVRLWKGYLSRQHKIRWQRDFFDHRIRDAGSLQEKAHYIRQNPVQAGLVKKAEAWPYIWEPDSDTQLAGPSGQFAI